MKYFIAIVVWLTILLTRVGQIIIYFDTFCRPLYHNLTIYYFNNRFDKVNLKPRGPNTQLREQACESGFTGRGWPCASFVTPPFWDITIFPPYRISSSKFKTIKHIPKWGRDILPPGADFTSGSS